MSYSDSLVYAIGFQMDDIRIHREGVKKIWFLIDEIELANQPISDVRGEEKLAMGIFSLICLWI